MRIFSVMVAAILAAVGLLGPAGSANAAMSITSVSIDCAGDRLEGVVTFTGASPGAHVKITLAGQGPGGWATLGSTQIGVGQKTSVKYAFDIASEHRLRYRATATVGSQTRTSETIADATCAPPTEVPEAPWAALLPLSMLAAGAGLFAWRRTRRPAAA